MDRTVERGAEGTAGYDVRRLRADDVDAFLELLDAVDGRDRGREWFRWKFEENPYVYHVPVFVAERTPGRAGAGGHERAGGHADGSSGHPDTDLVAAQPFFVLELSVAGQRHLALQPCETLVHPDHRGRGLRSRLNDAAVRTYREDTVRFVFDFVDEPAGAGYERLGWERVGDVAAYCRAQDSNADQEPAESGWASRAVEALRPLLPRSQRPTDRRLRTPRDVTVEAHESVPAGTLASIEYDTRRTTIHALRDRRYYGWRFDDPTREYTTYVAERRGEPVAAVVVAASSDDGTAAELTEVTPYPRADPHGALEALLGRVVDEHADEELLAAPSVLPKDLAARAGFRPDDRLQLTARGDRRTQVVRELGHGLDVTGVDVAAAENWAVTFADRDPG